MKKVKAFMFDMDDTIVESENINISLIGKYFFTKWNLALDLEDQDIVYGHSWQDIYAHLIRKYELQSTIYDIQNGVMDFKREYLAANKLKLASGLGPVLALPHRKVIVSGSGKDEIAVMMESTGLAHHFEASFSVDEYLKGKPDPAGFLMALNYLAIEPEEALVFEDSGSGLLSARNAGIKSVFIKEFAAHDHSAHADLSFADFHEFYEYFKHESP